MLTLFLPFFALFFVLLALFGRELKNSPPGPWGLPLIGHLAFLGQRPYVTLMNWKTRYGPMIFGRMGSFPAVFLCDAKTIKKVFSMAETAGRGDFSGRIEKQHQKGLLWSEVQWQTELRHFALRILKDFGVGRKSVEGHLQDALGIFLEKVRIKGDDGRRPITGQHIANHEVLRPLCRILMTQELTQEEADKMGRLVQKSVELGPIVGQLALFMPWMETLTKSLTFKRISLVKERSDTLKGIYSFMEVQIRRRKVTWVKGQPRDIVDVFFDTVEDTTKNVNSAFHPSHSSLVYFAGDLIIAGVHTTAISMEWMILYMASFPSIQKKIQEEIDLVVGPSRLPTLSDRPLMPYVDATIYEILRLSSIAPLGMDHKTLKEVTLQGYRIPKGTLVLANIFGVHHDPEIWGEDVEEFNPGRWLGDNGRKLKSDHFIPFSTGKRSCIGETLARDTLLIFMAGIFQTFNVTFENGCSGPGLTARPGLDLSPEPFNVVFSPRHGYA